MTARLASGLVLTAAILTGCAAVQRSGEPFSANSANTDEMLSRALAAAAERAAEALERLADAEAATGPVPGPEPSGHVPSALLQPVDFSWTGPLEAAARSLAGKANYELSVAGKPASPVLVTLKGSQVPLITLFREAGLQAGARATLRVSPERRLIEVIYAE